MSSKHGEAERFQDLRVYQAAFELQQAIFEVTKGFPREEQYALTDQLRRSSRSVGASIAEAWKKRRYEAHFVSKLSEADAESAETEHWLDTALTCNDMSPTAHADLIGLSRGVGRMLGTMMRDAALWCSPRQ